MSNQSPCGHKECSNLWCQTSHLVSTKNLLRTGVKPVTLCAQRTYYQWCQTSHHVSTKNSTHHWCQTHHHKEHPVGAKNLLTTSVKPVSMCTQFTHHWCQTSQFVLTQEVRVACCMVCCHHGIQTPDCWRWLLRPAQPSSWHVQPCGLQHTLHR